MACAANVQVRRSRPPPRRNGEQARSKLAAIPKVSSVRRDGRKPEYSVRSGVQGSGVFRECPILP